VELFRLRGTDPPNDDLKKLANEAVTELLAGEALLEQYNLLVLHDESYLQQGDADRIYSAVSAFTAERPLLLVLNSNGGRISAAYFISKVCREAACGRFVVAVPRRAKSAATLICCGADEIHMGSLSELGPIDPQFEGVPALALKHAVEHVAELVKRYPAASDMLATYLTKALPLQQLGYYERVAESATQYAQRLLARRTSTSPLSSEAIARQLVYDYKDHHFVIDASEASTIFGPEIVRTGTTEYQLANKLYGLLDVLESILSDFYERNFFFTGAIDAGAVVVRRPPPK
jgi:membrane-bound ClpP family serine protease